MISWRVFGVFQHRYSILRSIEYQWLNGIYVPSYPDSHFPTLYEVITKTILLSDGMMLYSNFELVMKGGYLL